MFQLGQFRPGSLQRLRRLPPLIEPLSQRRTPPLQRWRLAQQPVALGDLPLQRLRPAGQLLCYIQIGAVNVPPGLPLGLKLIQQLQPVLVGEGLFAEGTLGSRPLQQRDLLPERIHLRPQYLVARPQLRLLLGDVRQVIPRCLPALR